MRLPRLALLWLATLAGCDADSSAIASIRDCTRIVSALERLDCFDTQAGTPPQATGSSVPVTLLAHPNDKPVPEITALVRASERRRHASDNGLLLARSPDALAGQSRVVISAPAFIGPEPRPYLVISCLSNISRLQLLTVDPLFINRTNLRLMLDGQPVSARRPWQVVEDGTVTDAGRGLVAIEQLRPLERVAQRLTIESSDALFDGLVFDVSRLHHLLPELREACHW